MPTRVETAAATRCALLEAAGALLDVGGLDAVTLRDVGARAGVSRSAPYRHFTDKDDLLMALAVRGWTEVGDALAVLLTSADTASAQSLRLALMSLVTLGRSRPHLYRLMFTPPRADPAAAVAAADRAQNLFLEIVGNVVPSSRATPHDVRRYAGLLLTSAHGITALELSGHLATTKWQATAEDLIDLQIRLLSTA